MKNTPLPRERLAASPLEVLRRLPSIGKLMLTANHLGVTHERIGVVETIATDGTWGIVSGTEHDSRIELGTVAEIIVDRTSAMQDKAYPHIEFLRVDGSEICHVVGFDGLAPFDEALAMLGPGSPADARPAPVAREKTEVDAADAAMLRFEEARSAGAPVVIAFRRPGFQQKWTGVIEAVKPAMGFVNVMRPDFHLHIRAGAVGAWLSNGTIAVSPAGEPIGLSIEVLH
jgi:putative heme degradation protein